MKCCDSIIIDHFYAPVESPLFNMIQEVGED